MGKVEPLVPGAVLEAPERVPEENREIFRVVALRHGSQESLSWPGDQFLPGSIPEHIVVMPSFYSVSNLGEIVVDVARDMSAHSVNIDKYITCINGYAEYSVRPQGILRGIHRYLLECLRMEGVKFKHPDPQIDNNYSPHYFVKGQGNSPYAVGSLSLIRMLGTDGWEIDRHGRLKHDSNAA